jgi:carbon-monoxide dehydrogenase large subunit
MGAEFGIGASVKRKEDFRFITGRGNYLDDINRPGQAYGCFVRSPHAHAKIASIDAKKAAKMPGVVRILTGADLQADKIGGLICGWNVKSKDGTDTRMPKHPALATDTVRYVGDAVALVVAETFAQARDGAEAVKVKYEVLPAQIDVAKADKKGAVIVHADVRRNMAYDWEIGDKKATDAAFAKAAHVAKLDLVNNRVAPNAIEPRAAIGEYSPSDDSYTLYTTSQNPHVARLVLSAFVQIAPEHKLRVVSPDMGGGFGSKIFIYPDETAVIWAAKKVGRPVKWTSDRAEAFQTDCHGRDHVTHVELALDKAGKFLGLRVSTKANMGAYLSTFASCVPSYLYGTLLQGQYTTGAIYCEVKAVFTHTTPVDAVRGAGRPEATYVVERIIDVAARDLKIDPADLRRRNMIQPNAFPYQTQVALQYDSGNYPAALTKALEIADYKGFAQRRDEAKRRGKLRGIGLSSYIEACGIAPSAVVGSLGCGVGLYEGASVRMNPTGSAIVYIGSHSHGQGHETTFSQVVHERLGVPFEQIEIVHGDTGKIPFGMGTYGSRSIAVGGVALQNAVDKLIEKGRKIAAHKLEVAESDIQFKDGTYSVVGTDKKASFAEVTFAAYVPHNYPAGLEPGMEATAFYDPANFTFPAGTHVCEVEVDPDTGGVEIVKWSACDDFGRVINPMIVEGQVHGGIAHGVGQALLEGCVYDKSGQLLTASYMDYAMPRADNLPTVKVDTIQTPCPHNALGVKGCGEAGAIAAPAAVVNAIANALDVKHVEMPATAERVWQALNA